MKFCASLSRGGGDQPHFLSAYAVLRTDSSHTKFGVTQCLAALKGECWWYTQERRVSSQRPIPGPEISSNELGNLATMQKMGSLRQGIAEPLIQ
jgi:hypothetical protein